jgi:Uma2 family endonuclease
VAVLRHHVWTVKDYLTYERGNDRRHEYLDGAVYAMAGAGARHNLIVANVVASLHTQLRERPCLVYPSDMRLKVSSTGLYTYPDVSVVCASPLIEDEQEDTLLNPTLLIEVLLPSKTMTGGRSCSITRRSTRCARSF